jgi:hypothetical protein
LVLAICLNFQQFYSGDKLMPPEALIATRPINFIGEMWVYFIFGGLAHITITMLFAFFVLPIDFVLNNHRIHHQLKPISLPLISKLFLFSFLLFLWGLPGYFLFLTTVTNQLYIQGDPIVDWHPLLPRGCEIFSPSFGGRLINGATCKTLRLAWLLVAIPVWSASFLSCRYLVTRWKKTK